jgi:hypothetical protein
MKTIGNVHQASLDAQAQVIQDHRGDSHSRLLLQGWENQRDEADKEDIRLNKKRKSRPGAIRGGVPYRGEDGAH